MLKKSLQSYKNLLKFTYFCIEKYNNEYERS